jgi:Zn-dependent protease with chaperone function
MSQLTSLRSRAAICAVLIVGFYVLSLGLSALLLWIASISWKHGVSGGGRIILFCLLGAGSILFSIIPRREQFVPPGPPLKPAEEPGLTAEIRSIANATGQPMPNDIYLSGDVNAGVLQRSRGRRVLLIGLPLMQTMTVLQFRAVLAHEFGHFYGGDTQLGPWIYRAHKSMLRTLESLSKARSQLFHIFAWYTKLFLRISRSISRQQELSADALAARVTSAKDISDGLRGLARNGALTQIYWQSEVLPLLRAGYLPPLAAGFAEFLTAPWVQSLKIEETGERESEEKLYDSHPPLAERLEALAKLARSPLEKDSEDGEQPAIRLLQHVRKHERALIALANPGELELKSIEWNEVTEKLTVPSWRVAVRQQASALEGLTAAALPQVTSNFLAFASKTPDPPGMLLTREQRKENAIAGLAGGLGLGLLQEGWKLDTRPGRLDFERDGQIIRPFEVVQKLINGDLRPEEWQKQCESAKISSLPLCLPHEMAGAAIAATS